MATGLASHPWSVRELLDGAGHAKTELMSEGPVFYVAPFSPDGELLDVGKWALSQLSPKWIEFCRQLLIERGDIFQITLTAPFPNVTLRFTSACGNALATYLVEGQLATSAALLRGENMEQEHEVLSLFVQSLRNTEFAQTLAIAAKPFQSVYELSERPLHIVIPWGNLGISDESYELVAELGNHLAAAFLCESAASNT